FYVNNCGGQDELVFDGHSLVMDKHGELIAELPHCKPTCAHFHIDASGVLSTTSALPPQPHDKLEAIYQALVLSVRDYVAKNGFKGVTLGLSGGIDSALTLAVAVDALGPEQCHAIMMPFRYTSQMSQDDAREQAKRM